MTTSCKQGTPGPGASLGLVGNVVVEPRGSGGGLDVEAGVGSRAFPTLAEHLAEAPRGDPTPASPLVVLVERRTRSRAGTRSRSTVLTGYRRLARRTGIDAATEPDGGGLLRTSRSIPRSPRDRPGNGSCDLLLVSAAELLTARRSRSLRSTLVDRFGMRHGVRRSGVALAHMPGVPPPGVVSPRPAWCSSAAIICCSRSRRRISWDVTKSG